MLICMMVIWLFSKVQTNNPILSFTYKDMLTCTQDISKSKGWTAMKFTEHIHVPQRMNPSDFVNFVHKISSINIFYCKWTVISFETSLPGVAEIEVKTCPHKLKMFQLERKRCTYCLFWSFMTPPHERTATRRKKREWRKTTERITVPDEFFDQSKSELLHKHTHTHTHPDFGLHQVLRRISDSWATKCSTMFTSLSLTVSVAKNVALRAVRVYQKSKVEGPDS